MIFLALILLGGSMFLANFPSLMVGQFRNEIVGIDEVLNAKPAYNRFRLLTPLLSFGTFFLSLVTFAAIPGWQVVAFVSPAFAALVSGLLAYHLGVINLSRNAFFSNKYLLGDAVIKITAIQIALSVVLIGIAILLRGLIGAISM